MTSPTSPYRAAAKVATALGVKVTSRRENELDKKFGYINTEWRLSNLSGVTTHSLRLECRSGWGAGGDWWSGSVELLHIVDPDKPSVIVASERLVDPCGLNKGAKARKLSRARFCQWADNFAEKTSQI